MAKKKAKTQDYTFLDDVKKKLPALYAKAASLQPFDDVIHTQWVNKEQAHFGIGIQDGGGAWPSGSYDTYGARIYADKVLLFQDTYLPKDDGDKTCCREEHVTDMAGLWAYLRQLSRPISSFGKWTGGR